MKKNNYVEVVDKIRGINMFPDTNIHFTVHASKDINGIVRKKELANLILFLDKR